MANFFKKRAAGDPKEPGSKRARREAPPNTDVDRDVRGDPLVIVAWNCNGLTPRLRSESDVRAIRDFLLKYTPDIMFLSEVRVSAAYNGTSSKSDQQAQRVRGRMRQDDSKSSADVSLVQSLLSTPELRSYAVRFSLADTKYAGTAMLWNKKTVRSPKVMRYNLEREKSKKHHPEGRVIYAKFENFSVLHTYSPNNGWEEKHFQRRRAWDNQLKQFMARKRESGIKVIWIGDLNVAPKDEDLSHPTYYRSQTKGSRDVLSPMDVGQPGCTDGERNRFAEILDSGDMVDAYRQLVGDSTSIRLSWRGHPTGKHGGRGMRIDHCIVSRELASKVASVEITGHGADRQGFLGSDHCPIVVCMLEAKPEQILKGSGSENLDEKCEESNP
ncbi:Endonuclease/Exonuclease/phosphatase [Gracilaria domingensis]|nr:Endonuclease/Exonuclease/phosphatase [Gracilaria domingensis]